MKIIFVSICIFSLSNCAPVTMTRYQQHLSQIKLIAGVAQKGHLDLVVFGAMKRQHIRV